MLHAMPWNFQQNKGESLLEASCKVIHLAPALETRTHDPAYTALAAFLPGSQEVAYLMVCFTCYIIDINKYIYICIYICLLVRVA